MASATNRVHHDKFYYGDGNIVLLVETTLFNLHRAFLCRDPDSVFRTMFSYPAGSEEGTSDDNPILLPDVKTHEFSNLISALYSTHFVTKLDPNTIPTSEWLPLLKLADKFSLDSVTKLIVFSMSSASIVDENVVEYLNIAMKFKGEFSSAYCYTLFRKLCLRPTPLTMEEGDILGGPVTALVGQCREAFYSVWYGVRDFGANTTWADAKMKERGFDALLDAI